MCRKLILNAGLSKVVMRNTETQYTVAHVEDWIRCDDSILGPDFTLED